MATTARDSGGGSAAQSVRALPPGSAPEPVGTIPDQTVRERGSAWFLAFPYFAYPDGEHLEYSAVSADESVATVKASGRRVMIRGVAPGTTTVKVTGRDSASRDAFQQVGVTVERVNRRPEAVGEIPEQTVSVGEAVSLDLAPYFTDPDGDPLLYQANVLFDRKAAALMSGSVMTIVGLGEGSSAVTVTASDPDGEKAWLRTRITIEAFNRPPEVVGTIPEQTLNAGDTFSVDVAPYFGDAEGDDPDYEATSTSEHAAVSMAGAMVRIVAASVGRAFIVVKSRASGGRMAFPVRVIQLNRAPEAVGEIPAQAVTAGRTTVLADVSAYFHDPDEDPLAYSSATSDEKVATASVEGTEVVIAGVAEGKAIIRITARDPEGLWAEQAFSVTVWAEDGVTGTVLGCKVFVDLFFVRTLHISGRVRASRSVRDVVVHTYANGSSVGAEELGDLAAGEEKPFSRNQKTSLARRPHRSSITLSWRDVPDGAPSGDS